MRAGKIVLATLLILCLVGVGVTVSCANKSGSTADGAAGPINTSWNPIYVDNEVQTLLDKADLVKEISPA